MIKIIIKIGSNNNVDNDNNNFKKTEKRKTKII